jgi:hypothetical protein
MSTIGFEAVRVLMPVIASRYAPVMIILVAIV